MVKKEVVNYLKEVRKIYLSRDYTEMTFRTAIENLIKNLNPDFNLIHEPKRVTDLGAPDYKAFLGSANVGYIETKNLGVNLDNALESEQLRKYIESIDNLILTNYARFILIRKGEKGVLDLNLFSILDLENSRFKISDDNLDAFLQFFGEFFSYKLPTIKSAEDLAKELAKKAKLLKVIVEEQLIKDKKNDEEAGSFSPIYDFYLGIRSLIKDISIENGADAYAQTVTYSLFLAKKNSPDDDIDRISAYAHIPENVGIIKQMFTNMSGSTFPSNISWIIDDIVDILNVTDMDEVFATIDSRGKTDKDPILFLYEDFLNFYDPEMKQKLGVFYTERPIVGFIVNSIHYLLKEYFDKPNGFADDTVTVLDPASGTGTFFWIAYLKVLNELKVSGLSGLIPEKIHQHLLKNFYGFEILITPYVISHLKLYDLIQKWHYRFKKSDRIQIYLTNTLKPADKEPTLLPFLGEIRTENIATAKIKTNQPILVIIGNPPYAGESANKGKWVDDLLKKGYIRADGSQDDGYYRVDNDDLDESNTKWLQDDYVKFIRFAQKKIDKNGEGIVAYITNHNYLDNPTFRGMRESLFESFDRIYVLNLHGSILKQEKCPDGSKDENVFNIKPGVAISIFIKNNQLSDKKIFYSDLWGLRNYKFSWLDRHTVNNVDWEEIKPSSPFYFFVPKDDSLKEEYESFWKITDIFGTDHSVGITTARDPLTIQWTEEDVSIVIDDFAKREPEEAKKEYNLRKDARDWKVHLAQKDLITTDLDKNKIVPILYRPFDVRYTYYTGKTKGFHCMPRDNVMKNMFNSNLALCTCRQQVKTGFQHVFVSDKIVVSDIVSNKSKEVGHIFPLYIYSDDEDVLLNYNSKFIEFIHEIYKGKVKPEEIFYYIYAVLHSPQYRSDYSEFLKYDFPRIPFVNYNKFIELSEIGKQLIELHLMRKKLRIKTKFDIEGSNIVENFNYNPPRLWINDKQYFEGIPPIVWNFRIGGYQVLDKWLYYRKNKHLNTSEIENLLQMIEIIKITIVSMRKIDEILFN